MNEDHTENSETENTASETPASESREAFKDLTEAAKDAFKAGATDARDAVKRIVPEAKSDVRKGVHDLAYGLAYALSFGSTLLKEITPDAVVSGFSEGTTAGRKAADNMVEKRKTAAAEQEGEAANHQGAEPSAA